MGVLVGVAVADREVHRLSPISEQRGSTVSRSLVHKYTPEALSVQLVSLASTVQSPGYVPNGAINSGVVTDSKPLYTTLAMPEQVMVTVPSVPKKPPNSNGHGTYMKSTSGGATKHEAGPITAPASVS